LKKLAKEQLPSRTAEIAEIMGVKPAGVKITSAEKRWGSCSGRNTICYSYRVMMLPQELIDFVIIHELAHIKEKNHGVGFYRIVEGFEPDYREKMKKIKEISLVLPK
ncbi:MAG: M48 family metallopeptidase, partial [Oscillospiraceae bacterium]|nr:M48 family metallopeptidase [Oscillospiraceae bacterium]